MKNRNAFAKKMKNEGRIVIKSSIRNQLLHPQYIEDMKDTISVKDKGFGNTIYKTHFSVLYKVDVL